MVMKTEKNRIVKPIRIPDRELMNAVSATDKSAQKALIAQKINNKYLIIRP